MMFETNYEEDEKPTGKNCPKCSYPTVYELDTELCYNCGWCKAEDEKKD